MSREMVEMKTGKQVITPLVVFIFMKYLNGVMLVYILSQA